MRVRGEGEEEGTGKEGSGKRVEDDETCGAEGLPGAEVLELVLEGDALRDGDTIYIQSQL